MSKNYQNEYLKLRMENTVNKLPISDRYKPYIVDILMRRAHQYNLSGTQIQTDLDTISKSLTCIKSQRS